MTRDPLEAVEGAEVCTPAQDSSSRVLQRRPWQNLLSIESIEECVHDPLEGSNGITLYEKR